MGRHSLVEDPAPEPPHGRSSGYRSPATRTSAPRTAPPRNAPPRPAAPRPPRRAPEPPPSFTPAPPPEQGPERDVSTTGSHKAISATGSHRAIGKRRRRVATWPIACLVLVALLGLGWLGWGWASGELNSRAEAQAASCAEGDASLRVIVTPSAEAPVKAAATRWNDAKTVVHGHCVNITVDAMASQRVLDALLGQSELTSIRGMPAAWLPETSWWISELTTKKPEMIGSPAQSVASARSADYPYLGLSGNGVDDVQKRAAQTFRGFLTEPAQQADFAAAGLTAA
ncbi:hypothetical protein L3Q67_37245 [Saccharothrix sp. AJ9571]|nr:hypothetical protein L3Q67_37245 [Saccharothrix sp. AJ9571]